MVLILKVMFGYSFQFFGNRGMNLFLILRYLLLKLQIRPLFKKKLFNQICSRAMQNSYFIHRVKIAFLSSVYHSTSRMKMRQLLWKVYGLIRNNLINYLHHYKIRISLGTAFCKARLRAVARAGAMGAIAAVALALTTAL